jgi:hypothetical protein
MKEAKVNCWEFHACGRGLDGPGAQRARACRAATESAVDGANNGRNAGRACWAVAGTLGVDEPECVSGYSCSHCGFRRKVHKEELPHVTERHAILQSLGYADALRLGELPELVPAAELKPDAVGYQRPGRARLNCWEHMECGREPGGVNADVRGVCPATTDQRLDGVHGGINAGRACWVVSGTLCRGDVQGTFANKASCCFCSFYRAVVAEELSRDDTPGFMYTPALVRMLYQREPN